MVICFCPPCGYSVSYSFKETFSSAPLKVHEIMLLDFFSKFIKRHYICGSWVKYSVEKGIIRWKCSEKFLWMRLLNYGHMKVEDCNINIAIFLCVTETWKSGKSYPHGMLD